MNEQSYSTNFSSPKKKLYNAKLCPNAMENKGINKTTKLTTYGDKNSDNSSTASTNNFKNVISKSNNYLVEKSNYLNINYTSSKNNLKTKINDPYIPKYKETSASVRKATELQSHNYKSENPVINVDSLKSTTRGQLRKDSETNNTFVDLEISPVDRRLSDIYSNPIISKFKKKETVTSKIGTKLSPRKKNLNSTSEGVKLLNFNSPSEFKHSNLKSQLFELEKV